MENASALPEGYSELLEIDLQKDRKSALLVNGLALLIALPMVAVGAVMAPFSTLLDSSAGWLAYAGRWGVLLAGLVAYMLLHELVHGICMKHYSGERVRYGFTGLYAYAGSEAYFNKRSYLVIALAPIVVWGVVLLILNFLVPASWFWCVYFIQVCNVSGAAGDLYVSCKFSRLPADILIRDTGVSMTVYSRAERDGKESGNQKS